MNDKAARFTRKILVAASLWLLLAIPTACLAVLTDEQLALDVAEGWLDERNARLGEQFTRNITSVDGHVDESGDPLYFVVNLAPEGFILLSPDDEIEPIIAFSADGQYVDNTDNPLTTLIREDMKERKRQSHDQLFHQYQTATLKKKLSQRKGKSRERWNKYVSRAVDKRQRGLRKRNAPAEETLAESSEQLFDASSISDVVVEPFLQARWNQLTSYDSSFGLYNLYNTYTPNNYYSGCVATAISQVLRHYSFPTSGIGQVQKTIYVNGSPSTGTTRGGNGSGGAYDWAAMILQPTSQAYNAYAWNMIGSLMHDAGVAVSMQYSPSGSGAYMSSVAPALTDVFQYANAQRTYFYGAGDHSSEYEKILNSNMIGGYPVILGIVNTGTNAGHAVVADGYGYDGATLYHHVNMGWGGNSDAWYNLPSIGSYNTTPELIYNIFPSQNGELVSGRVVDQLGAPRSGVLVRAQAQSNGSSFSDTTDSNGYYSIIVPGNDTYDMIAQTVTVNNVSVGQSTSTVTANIVNTNITIADSVSSDQKSDLIWRNVNTGQVLTWLMDGTTQADSLVQGSIWGSMPSEWNLKGMGDFNGDGKDDLLWQNATSGMVFVWLLNDLAPADQLTQGAIWSSMPSEWVIKGVGDFDGDGKDDILWQNSSTGMIFVWCLDGVQTADQLNQGSIWDAMPSSWQIKGVADFDGDGKDDILWQNIDTGMVFVWCLNGLQKADQLTQGSIWDSMPATWSIDRLGDFNGDGKSDILWRHTQTGQLIVWLMDGVTRADAITQGVLWSSMPGEWQTTAVGDYNADGKDDLLWRHQTSGQLLAWFMNGTQSADQITQATIWSSMPQEWQVMAAGHVNGN
ncbi:MAG: C10 family peptidase [Gammaproteobacteria bacterium]|nr:C10 family peptidase [Gammaproteobacteria bacterium]